MGLYIPNGYFATGNSLRKGHNATKQQLCSADHALELVAYCPSGRIRLNTESSRYSTEPIDRSEKESRVMNTLLLLSIIAGVVVVRCSVTHIYGLRSTT